MYLSTQNTTALVEKPDSDRGRVLNINIYTYLSTQNTTALSRKARFGKKGVESAVTFKYLSIYPHRTRQPRRKARLGWVSRRGGCRDEGGVETRGVGPDQGRGSGDPEKPTRARELDETDFNPSLNARALPIKERN